MPSPEVFTHRAAFAAALVDADLPPPPGLLGRDGGPVGRRFAVHRATALFGCVEALRSRHPVIERMLGADCFEAVARAVVAQDPPRSALLLDWGEALPEVLAAAPDLAAWPFLADVARLEIAWARAHHAAEAEPSTLADLAEVAPADLAAATVVLHPSLGLVASAHPVVTLWRAHRREDDPEADVVVSEVTPPEVWAPECALVLRPDADVEVLTLDPAEQAFVTALAAGEPIAAAAVSALSWNAAFDAGTALVRLIVAGAVVGLAVPTPVSEIDR